MNVAPLTMVAIFACVFAPLELLVPARKRPQFSWRRYRTDLLHALVGGYAIRLGTALALTGLVALCGTWANAAALPLWAQVAALLLLSDLAFWLAHRLFHAVPALWQFHKIHHSSEHLDWLAAFRVHPVDQITNATIIALPSLLLGFSPLAVLAYGLIYQWHAIYLHSNVRISLGPLGKVLTTPQFHHWHHANFPEAYDKNFGGQLRVWDRLFGTEIDKAAFPTAYGLDDQLAESFTAHIVEPFRFRRGT